MNVNPFAHAGRRSVRLRPGSPDAALAMIAAVLLPLGLLVILIGWYGAAHTPYLFEQVPYLISGGLIGLGLMLTGGLLYFGSWIARAAATQRQASEETAGLLREIRDQLAVSPVNGTSAARTRKAGNGRHSFVATANGSMLHRPDCSVVSGRKDLRDVSEASGLQPCRLCDPLSAGPAAARL